MSVAPTAQLEPRLARHWVADVAACALLLRHNSRSFHLAAHWLPRRVREPATVLYGFCRGADDAVDEERDDPAAALARLQARLARVYAGQPLALPADRALAGVVAAYAIPRALPEFLLDGLRWDVEGRDYADLDALLAYAARVAGAVGVMMSLLMESRDPTALARAGDLGVAMQLSNIARDVGADARMGRLYLPLDWLREAGLHGAELAAWRQAALTAPQPDARINAVVLRLLDQAERLYQRAGAGLACLPWRCRPGIQAARSLYAAIGHAVRRQGGDGVQRRARVPGWRKLGLMLAAPATPFLPRADAAELRAPALPANQALLDAVAAQPAPPTLSAAEFVAGLMLRLARPTGSGDA